MNDIDDKILEALRVETGESFESYNEELGLFGLVGESFRGAFGWAVKLVFFFVFVFIGLTVYCAINFFHADDIATKLDWMAMGLAAFIVVAILRLWFFMELNRLSTKREVKRLELQVALLANKIQSPG